MVALSIYNYLDYRQFLKDLTRSLKKEKRFNLVRFAAQAGLRAPGYLKMVVDGQRDLTPETAKKFCKALDIRAREKDYFEALVLYDQATDPDEKKERFEELVSLRPRSSDFVTEKRFARYFSKPEHVFIREMVGLKDFREDSKWIKRRLIPRVSPAEIRRAIETLLELGILGRDEKGTLGQRQDVLKTEDRNTQVAEAFQYHEAMIDTARRVMGLLGPEERHLHAMTLPLPREAYQAIVNEYYVFRDRVMELMKNAGGPAEEVYQINFQLFPVTKKGERP